MSALAIVLDAWVKHFFFTIFTVTNGTALKGSRTVDPGPYGNNPETVALFVGTTVVMWGLLAVGVALLAWGVRDEWVREASM